MWWPRRGPRPLTTPPSGQVENTPREETTDAALEVWRRLGGARVGLCVRGDVVAGTTADCGTREGIDGRPGYSCRTFHPVGATDRVHGDSRGRRGRGGRCVAAGCRTRHA